MRETTCDSAKNTLFLIMTCLFHVKAAFLQVCALCAHCLTSSLRITLINAYKEHSNRQQMRRILPYPITVSQQHNLFSGGNALDLAKMERDLVKRTKTFLSDVDRSMYFWFYGKCMQDVTWCQ